MALKGVRVVEFSGLAPVPFCGKILADHGAHVIRIDKLPAFPNLDALAASKKSVSVNLKNQQGVAIVNKLIKNSDVLVEPFRPGIMEKMNLGPKTLLNEHPTLIYARLNGFGKFGEWSKKAGHDINFLALSGVLSRLGRPDSNPHPPINLLADFAGGGFVCALGIVLALYERSKSGKGQIVDCNMLSGSSYLASFLWNSIGTMGQIVDNPRGQNLLDGGCPFYDTYKTSDHKFMAVGALEPQFFHNLMAVLNISETYPLSEQFDKSKWADMKHDISQCFMTKTQNDWVALFEKVDACVTPVIEMNEAPQLEQNLENNNFVSKSDGRTFPNAAPTLSRSPGKIDVSSVGDFLPVGKDTRQVLLDIGLSHEEINKLVENGVVFCLDEKSRL